MRLIRVWFGAPRRLMWSFVLLLLLPAIAVAWLGLQLIEQDRDLLSRQLRERRESTADRLVAEIERAVSATERLLSGAPAAVPVGEHDDAVVVTIHAGRVETNAGNRLLYEPLPVTLGEASAVFATAAALEIGAENPTGAVSASRELTRSPNQAVRAEAWLRLARALRKTGRAAEALQAYEALAALPQTHASGLPADLVARRAWAALLAELNCRGELAEAAKALQADLLSRRWRLDRGAFDATRAVHDSHPGAWDALSLPPRDGAGCQRIVKGQASGLCTFRFRPMGSPGSPRVARIARATDRA